MRELALVFHQTFRRCSKYIVFSKFQGAFFVTFLSGAVRMGDSRTSGACFAERFPQSNCRTNPSSPLSKTSGTPEEFKPARFSLEPRHSDRHVALPGSLEPADLESGCRPSGSYAVRANLLSRGPLPRVIRQRPLGFDPASMAAALMVMTAAAPDPRAGWLRGLSKTASRRTRKKRAAGAV
jgi:hypothetical protein